MIIYRFEDKNHDGPYQKYKLFQYHNGTDNHPTERLKLRYSLKRKPKVTPEDYYAGFKSIYQLKKWFTASEIMAMFPHGLFLTIYNIPKEYVFFGRKQIYFYREKALRVKQFTRIIEIKYVLKTGNIPVRSIA